MIFSSKAPIFRLSPSLKETGQFYESRADADSQDSFDFNNKPCNFNVFGMVLAVASANVILSP